jgi:hypothetical protein
MKAVMFSLFGRVICSLSFQLQKVSNSVLQFEKRDKISYRMQNSKIRPNKRVFHTAVEYFLQLAKESLISFRAIAKGNLTPFRANCMRNPGICMQRR